MADDVKRLNYFNGQFLRQADFSTEQGYQLALQRDHARLMHVPGIAEGLDIPDPPAGASAITVQAGIAYDDLGRRMALANNLPMELVGFPANASVHITITYAEVPSDLSDETGTPGHTRVTEAPLVEAKTTPPANPSRSVVLAVVARSGTNVSSINRAVRVQAGARGGDMTVNTLNFGSDDFDPEFWSLMRLTAANRVTLNNDLQVGGTLTTGGTVNGRNIATDGTNNDNHRGSTANPHQTTAAQIDAQGGANRIVTQINAGTGIINDARINHVSVATGAHAATAISAAVHNNVAATTVQGQLQEIVADMAAQTVGSPGIGLVGGDALSGTPNSLAAGTLRNQLIALLGHVNGHVTAATGAHAATAISVADTANQLNAGTVEAALAEIVSAFANNHMRGDQTTPGQHRTLQQPALTLSNGVATILDSAASGQTASRFRIYADATSVWFLVNTFWNATAWQRDSTSLPASGFRLTGTSFEFLFENTAAAFTNFSRRWTLPMGSNINAGFETVGPIQDVGRLAMEWTNVDTATRNMSGGGSCTFRARFPNSPSSVTLTRLTSVNFVGDPSVYQFDRDGFGFFSSQNVPANQTCHWFGTFTAVS